MEIEGEPVPGVELDLPVHELTGEPRQDGGFRVRFGVPAIVDVTLTFRALGALGGLAIHSSLHLILRSHGSSRVQSRPELQALSVNS